MEVTGGDLELTEAGRAQGAQGGGTARVIGVALGKKRWYFEVNLESLLLDNSTNSA